MTEPGLKPGTQLSLFIKIGRMNEAERRVILNNLDRSNNEIAQMLMRSEGSICMFLHRDQIRRTDGQLAQIRARIGAQQTQENNPNWKNGRSRDNYYYKKRMIEKYPEKRSARTKVYRAVKAGKLERLPCEVCGDPKSEAHHHHGYESALDVQWLCRLHHNEVENQKKVG